LSQMTILQILTVGLATTFVASEQSDRTHIDFENFLESFGKLRPLGDAFTLREQIFTRNVKFVNTFNEESKDIRLAINQFADLTSAEFREMYLSSLSAIPVDQSETHQRFSPTVTELPQSIDWRSKGAVTPVKDQKNCGACWAFSATGAIEGAWFLAGHPLVALSEQELVDCSAGFRGGCSGGEPSAAMEWVKKRGICNNASYPWTSFQDECHNQFGPCHVAAKIGGYTLVEENNEQALKAAVAKQPVSVQIEADSDVFRFYKSGILKNSGCGTALDHAVLAVGYGNQDGLDYWLIKNSWNESWGDHGYVLLARTNLTSSEGECGVAMKPMFPVASEQAISAMEQDQGFR